MLVLLERPLSLWTVLVLLITPLVFAACEEEHLSSSSVQRTGEDGSNEFNCRIATGNLVDSGVGKDEIPALINPPLVGAEGERTGYLADSSRVIGLLVGDVPLAVPHNVLWFHEIVNLDDWAGRSLAVTYCPLTGSSLAFDRSAVDSAEFGVSGLLLDNNLVMYDRRTQESLWPQMRREASCGRDTGTTLPMIPVIEMRWDRWKTLHPDTKVLSGATGHGYFYGSRAYPYGDYERIDNDRLLFDGTSIDDRRPPKERVLGIPHGKGRGIALPFGVLDDGTPARVETVPVGGNEKTVFWSREARGAMAFETAASFSVRDDHIVDDATGSVWTVDGRAVEGPRAGEQLEPVETAYVAFWFAWAVFHPRTGVWKSSWSSSYI